MGIEHRTALIIGLGREGEALARFLLRRGFRVLINDRANFESLRARRAAVGSAAEIFLGEDRPDLVEQAQRVFVSPGVPETNAVYLAAKRADRKIESMTTLFFDECPAPIVGITGSSGKTTTTSLVGHILRTANRPAVIGGNIGDPMIDLLPTITPQMLVILELSSFQLAILERSPHIAVVTNISPNHLDRHGSMEAYVAAKRQIVAHQSSTDYVVLNANGGAADKFVIGTAGQVRWFGPDLSNSGATMEAGYVGVRVGAGFERVLPVTDIPLLGAHNVENVLAALMVAHLLGIPPADSAAAIRSFQAPTHRLETVKEVADVRYVDDSIATSPARAMVALQAIEQPIVLIAGGRDKALPWDEFAQLAVQRTRGLVLIGEAANDIERVVRRALEGHDAQLQTEMIRRCESLDEAVRAAETMAQPGDVVLLSPGCASYDMFHDYEERGAMFVQAVERLDAA